MADEPVWLPVAQAARRLGVSPQALRRRIKRGTIETREERSGNRVRTLIGIPAGTLAEPAAAPGAPEVVILREQVARLEERLTHADALRGRLTGEVAWLRTRLEAELARRRWPGLVPWLRRALWGDDDG